MAVSVALFCWRVKRRGVRQGRNEQGARAGAVPAKARQATARGRPRRRKVTAIESSILHQKLDIHSSSSRLAGQTTTSCSV